jgi:hypothetical protein
MDVFPVEALSDLHPRAECTDCGKILDRDADCLSGRATNFSPEDETIRNRRLI